MSVRIFSSSPIEGRGEARARSGVIDRSALVGKAGRERERLPRTPSDLEDSAHPELAAVHGLIGDVHLGRHRQPWNALPREPEERALADLRDGLRGEDEARAALA